MQVGITFSYSEPKIPTKDLIMPPAEKRTFSLSADQSSYIDRLVSSGNYATASEVVRAGLRALQECDAAVEQWLREEVVSVASTMEADPSRGIPAAEVFAHLRDFLAQRPPDHDAFKSHPI